MRREDHERQMTTQELAEALLGHADLIEDSLTPAWTLRTRVGPDPLLRVIALNQILLSRAMAELLTQINETNEEIARA